MPIVLKCFASLARFMPPDAGAYAVAPGETVGGLAARLGIPPDEVKLVFVNGGNVELDTVLHEGDSVSLLPAVGGG